MRVWACVCVCKSFSCSYLPEARPPSAALKSAEGGALAEAETTMGSGAGCVCVCGGGVWVAGQCQSCRGRAAGEYKVCVGSARERVPFVSIRRAIPTALLPAAVVMPLPPERRCFLLSASLSRRSLAVFAFSLSPLVFGIMLIFRSIYLFFFFFVLILLSNLHFYLFIYV